MFQRRLNVLFKDKYFFKDCPITPVIKYFKGELRKKKSL